jgi:osmotically-inducible protein OsmY
MRTFLNVPAAALCAYVAASICSAAAASVQNTGPVSDADLQQRVQYALHADRYFYDGHVEVVVDHGVVYLRGLVFSDWDLRDARRIATKAAVDRRVVNDLTLVEGGRR